MAELQARINVAIRHSTPQAAPRLAFDVIELDLLSRKVTAGGVEVRLTPTELEFASAASQLPRPRVHPAPPPRHGLGPQYQDDAHILRTFVHQLRPSSPPPRPAPAS